ncbi:MAG: hypothetical protein M3N91_18915 [Pseudomonadota bacterium]|nr:hypothetical protein [Pseudomonadota bacterium]
MSADTVLKMASAISHTRWGWEHSVEPGSYTVDQPMNLKSLLLLKDVVSRHPTMDVRFGPQQ